MKWKVLNEDWVVGRLVSPAALYPGGTQLVTWLHLRCCRLPSHACSVFPYYDWLTTIKGENKCTHGQTYWLMGEGKMRTGSFKKCRMWELNECRLVCTLFDELQPLDGPDFCWPIPKRAEVEKQSCLEWMHTRCESIPIWAKIGNPICQTTRTSSVRPSVWPSEEERRRGISDDISLTFRTGATKARLLSSNFSPSLVLLIEGS